MESPETLSRNVASGVFDEEVVERECIGKLFFSRARESSLHKSEYPYRSCYGARYESALCVLSDYLQTVQLIDEF